MSLVTEDEFSFNIGVEISLRERPIKDIEENILRRRADELERVNPKETNNGCQALLEGCKYAKCHRIVHNAFKEEQLCFKHAHKMDDP